MSEKKAETPEEKPKKKSGRSKAAKPAGKTEALFPVEELAANAGLPAWERAALTAATGWAPGKQVSRAAFEQALTDFRNRPQGGGRI